MKKMNTWIHLRKLTVKNAPKSTFLGVAVAILLTSSLLAACTASEPQEKTASAPAVNQEQKPREMKPEAGSGSQKEIRNTSSSVNTSGTTSKISVPLIKVIDGDTIKIMYEGKEKNLRYLLIDTPETNHPRLGKQPFGEEAKERNRQLLESGELTIEFDIGQRIDKYDRLLAYVYVDGESVQETLLKEGLARVAYVYPPNTRYLTSFEKAQTVAKSQGIGIWSVENYATDSGFDTDVIEQPEQKTPVQQKETTKNEYYQNCTELRKVYPNGVPEGHPAYQSKMDRDKDGYACER